MWKRGVYLLGGVVAVGLIKPVLKHVVRPLAVEAVKVGIIAGTAIHRFAQEVREDFEDLTAEASADVKARNASAAGSTPSTTATTAKSTAKSTA
jgi:hypothetical protein